MDRAELLTVLADILEKCVDRRPELLTENLTLREGLGLDSIDIFSLVVETQSRFGIDIPTQDMSIETTVGDVLDLIQSKLVAKSRAA